MANEKKGLIDITTGAEITDANANGILDLASSDVAQLANMGPALISASQWGYLGGTDQELSTGATVTFTGLGITSAYTFPAADGAANYVLTSHNDGTTTWEINAASTAWGDITGTVSNQTDLQTALDAKQDMAPVGVPALPNSTGTQGTWSYGSGYLYICTATDTWIRVAVVTSWS